MINQSILLYFIGSLFFIGIIKKTMDFIKNYISHIQISERIHNYILTNKKKSLSRKISHSNKNANPNVINNIKILLILCSAIFITLTITILNFSLTSIIISIILITTILGLHLITTNIKNKQIKQFIKELPEALDLLARNISSGLSIIESIKMVAENFTGLIAYEFQLINNSITMGATLQDALSEAAKRIKITEFSFFSIIVFVNQKTGGNIVDLLSNLSITLRNKIAIEQKIKALSSESIASAIIISILPVLIIAMLVILNPTYISPLLTESIGHIMIAFCFLLQIIGTLLIKKIIKIDI